MEIRGIPKALFTLAMLTGCAGSAETACDDPGHEAGAMHGHHDHRHATAGGEHDPAHGHEPADGHGAGHAMGSMQHDFSDVARFEAMFDAPERAAWQRPAAVTQMLEIAPGQTVVDLGAGTGYFLPFLSVAVGPQGHVLGLDTEPAMVAHMTERAAREGLANVRARVVAPASPELSAASVDHVLIVDTWHHLGDRRAYSAALAAALTPGGSVVVVDFTAEASHGPPVADRVPAETVAEELASAGLHAEIVAEDLPEQYVVRARR